MTSILVSTSHGTNSNPRFEPSRIPRVQERSLNTSSLPGGGLAHTLVYKKPAERPSPRLNPPVELDELNPTESDNVKILKMKELLYHMKRNQRIAFCDDRHDVDTETFPTWSVYQSKIETDSISEPVEIMYNPIIMANPTNLNTVYTTLRRTKEQIQALGQKVCPIVFDMGLLMKALEITWSNPTEFEGIIPIEGGMHYMMPVFGGIGHIYGNAGLKELLYESEVFAKNTVDHIQSGKDFDRALKALLMVGEVMNRRFMHQFRLWAKNEISVCNLDMQLQQLHLHDLPILQNGIPPELEQLIQLEIQPLIEKFRLEGRAVSPIFRFWDSYLTDISMPMKLFLSSSRHAIWDVNKYAKTKLLPFLFSSNRSNYMKFMSYQVLATNRLPEALSVCFEKGLFVSKLSRGRFNSVWYDYMFEVTENKALKSSGGIIGITHNENALTRWFTSRPLTARYATEYSPRNVDSQENTKDKHHSDSNCTTKVYNDGVNKMLRMFDDTFIDPFSLTCPPERLVNFASGVEASSEVEKSLFGCHDQGKQMLENFVKQRLVVSNDTNSTEKNFFEHMPRPNIKTMTNMNSGANTKSSVKTINGEEMYLRLLAINSYKKISVERVLSFENAHVPLSLFKDDGSMMSTKKSDFLSKLEHIAGSSCAVKTISESADFVIYDAMGIVQMITPNPGATFFDVATAFWTYILHHSGNVASIHVVFDRYLPNSLKAATRQKRGEKSAINMPSVFRYKMLVPEWKKLLTSTQSKSQLTNLYTKYFTENCHTLLKEGQIVYVSGGFGEKILKMTCDTVLFHSVSTQEEADTRMLLHLLYASKEEGVRKATITSPDTDVFVLLLHHFSNFMHFGVEQIYFKTGRKSSYTDLTRLIPVHEVFMKLSPAERCILLAVYCLTGCDTCSSFHGVGKKKTFKIMRKNAEMIKDLSQLGAADDITPKTKAAALLFVALLYGYSNKQCCSSDTLRSRLVLKNVRTKPRKLPPTDDSFILHLYMCLYQLLIWRSALDPCPSLPDPIDYGYRLDQETDLYTPKMMNQAAAPPELLSDLVCSCKDLCGEECACSLNEQPCTVACECKATVDTDPCSNIFTVLASIQEDILE